jgi:gas vesicle protein
MSDERHSAFGTLVTFLTGAALGAGLALLFAPQSGEETRKKIKDVSDKVSDDVKENYEKVSKEAQKAIENVKTASEKAINQMKTFIDGAKDNLKKEIKAETKAPAKKKVAG